MSQERHSGISRVVGVSPERERELLRSFQERFESQEPFYAEREKTIEERETFGEIIRRLPDFIRRYGGEPAPVTEDHIHIIDRDLLNSDDRAYIEAQPNENGWYRPQTQKLGVLRHHSPLQTAIFVTHELFHMNSFASYTERENELDERRSGLAMGSRHQALTWFKKLNEAVIEELTIRFDEEHFSSIPTLQDLCALRAEMREADERAAEISSVVTEQLPDGMWQTTIYENYGYKDERVRLNQILGDLVRMQPDRFPDTEAAFNLFARAALSGKVLELARTIGSIYGPGGFKQLAEETAAPDRSENIS